MRTAIVLFLLILLFCLQNNLNRKNNKEKRGFPLGKSKFNAEKVYQWKNNSILRLVMNSEYQLDKLPLEFVTNRDLTSYINNNICVEDQERIWNIYDFYISNGFYFSEYECKRAMIFVYIEDWNIHMNFSVNINGRYIAPEKNTICLLKKGDIIYSTEFYSDKIYNFLLIY